jgi:diguanylate cyclase (GGDEF)-like protein
MRPATGGDSVVVRFPGNAPAAEPSTPSDQRPDPLSVPSGPARIVVTDGIVTEVVAPTLDDDSVVGRQFTSLVHPDDETTVKALLDADDGSIHTLRLVAADGETSQLELSLESRGARRVTLRGWDVTAHVRRQQVLEQLALHDPLTGLANRLLFGERLHDELRRRRRTGSALAVLYADLDGFKTVNDTWGHRAGDLLLSAVAARLRNCLRPGDVLARLGGDEFGVCCPDINGSEAALAVAHRLVEEATAPVNLGGAVVRVSMSVGVALAEDEDVTDYGGRLLARADLAMYAAKHRGRDRVAISPTSGAEAP